MMEDILIFIGFIIFSVVGFSCAIGIIDSRVGWNKIIPIGILSAIADYLIKEIIVPKFNLPDGIHLITGVIFQAVVIYFLLKYKPSISFGVSIFTYLISAISEISIIILLMLIFGKETLIAWTSDKTNIIIVGLFTILPMIITILIFKFKNIILFDTNTRENFYRM
jgi:hypothetical protein